MFIRRKIKTLKGQSYEQHQLLKSIRTPPGQGRKSSSNPVFNTEDGHCVHVKNTTTPNLSQKTIYNALRINHDPLKNISLKEKDFQHSKDRSAENLGRKPTSPLFIKDQLIILSNVG